MTHPDSFSFTWVPEWWQWPQALQAIPLQEQDRGINPCHAVLFWVTAVPIAYLKWSFHLVGMCFNFSFPHFLHLQNESNGHLTRQSSKHKVRWWIKCWPQARQGSTHLWFQLFRKQRQEDSKFKSSPGKVSKTPSQKKQNKTTTKRGGGMAQVVEHLPRKHWQKKHWALYSYPYSTNKNPCSFLLLLILSLQQN
jgi:hypothetical protein